MAKFSISDWATCRTHGPPAKLTEAQISGFALGFARLMNRLGGVGRHVEVMRVVPWIGTSRSQMIYFDVVFVISMTDSDKIELKVHLDFGHKAKEIEQDPERIANAFCDFAYDRVLNAVKAKVHALTVLSESWLSLLPEETA